MKNNAFKAFTLAEVLITLSILGIIAAITIGSIIPRYQERVRIVRLKKAYAILTNSYEMAQSAYGPITSWWQSSDVSVAKYDKNKGGNVAIHYASDAEEIAKMLYYGISYEEKEIPSYRSKYMGKFSDNNPEIGKPTAEKTAVYITKDGIKLPKTLWIGNKACNTNKGGKATNVCGDIHIDVNGAKGPNIIGVDIFNFYVTPDGFVPIGGRGQTERPLTTYCDYNGTIQYNGYGCTAWALEKGNQDYLRKKVNW